MKYRYLWIMIVWIFLYLSGAAGFGFPDENGSDWTQMRGSARDGISAETKLADSWPESGPAEVWRKNIGDGYSGVAVSGDRLFITFSHDGKEKLFCLNAGSGGEIWQFALNDHFDEQFGDGPRATPTIDGETVYAIGSYGILYSLNAKNGQKNWELNIHQTFSDEQNGPFNRGYASSPLILGDTLIICGSIPPGKTVVALNKHTGKTIWTYQNGTTSYSSPMLMHISGHPQIVSSIGYGMAGIDPKTGAELWKYRWETSYELNIVPPLQVAPDKVMISSGYDKGAALVQLQQKNGSWEVNELWTNRLFRNHFNGSVLLDGFLYGFDNKNLKCINALTGEEQWANRDFGKGSVILADDKLYVQGENGQIALVKATPTGYTELGRHTALTGRCWTIPALANGKLYVRNMSELVCYDVK